MTYDCVTTHRMVNGPYPRLQITWEKERRSYYGKCVVWEDPNTRLPCEHTISVCETSPLGSIHFSFDELKSGYGAWKFSHIEASGITDRDLLWAGSWAVLALGSRHQAVSPCELIPSAEELT